MTTPTQQEDQQGGSKETEGTTKEKRPFIDLKDGQLSVDLDAAGEFLRDVPGTGFGIVRALARDAVTLGCKAVDYLEETAAEARQGVRDKRSQREAEHRARQVNCPNCNCVMDMETQDPPSYRCPACDATFTPPPMTTSECPTCSECGSETKPGDEGFRCTSCGHVQAGAAS